MTIRRFFMAAGMSALLLAATTPRARADQLDDQGLPICCCAYHLWTCTYNDGSYWDGCDPTWTADQILTIEARAWCLAYHPAP